MIALYRLLVITPLGARKPISEWSDNLDLIMEASLKYDREHLRIERVIGRLEISEVPVEAQEEYLEGLDERVA